MSGARPNLTERVHEHPKPEVAFKSERRKECFPSSLLFTHLERVMLRGCIQVDRENLLMRKQEWLRKLEREGKVFDPKEDHRLGLRALQHGTRREILRFIGYDTKTLDEIKNRFGLNEGQAKFHLSMLEQALYVEKTGEDYRLTPRGIAYLENVESRQ